MSSLILDAEALYSDLLRGMRQQLASYTLPPKLVGVASGGAWLAQRLQKDLQWPDPAAL
jgi:pyrimidine operon attenuation protein/uracil phosphoribosyltransferase